MYKYASINEIAVINDLKIMGLLSDNESENIESVDSNSFDDADIVNNEYIKERSLELKIVAKDRLSTNDYYKFCSIVKTLVENDMM